MAYSRTAKREIRHGRRLRADSIRQPRFRQTRRPKTDGICNANEMRRTDVIFTSNQKRPKAGGGHNKLHPSVAPWGLTEAASLLPHRQLDFIPGKPDPQPVYSGTRPTQDLLTPRRFPRQKWGKATEAGKLRKHTRCGGKLLNGANGNRISRSP